jgi:hypothetical protein
LGYLIEDDERIHLSLIINGDIPGTIIYVPCFDVGYSAYHRMADKDIYEENETVNKKSMIVNYNTFQTILFSLAAVFAFAFMIAVIKYFRR